ncbi:hypothetical protein OAO87_04405 [bacterium]|nr:hypothetical protein [bacterium]
MELAVAVEISEPGQSDLLKLSEIISGLSGDRLLEMYSHFDAHDASTLEGLQRTLATYEPQLAASVVRNLLRTLREAGVRPIDQVLKDKEHPQTEEVAHSLCHMHIPCLQHSLTARVPCLRRIAGLNKEDAHTHANVIRCCTHH